MTTEAPIEGLEEFSAAQLERGARRVQRIKRDALLEVMAEPPMTVAEAVARYRSTVNISQN
jgi:hypothetical protein